MKKPIKTRIRNWKIGDYIRQFSIVAGGVLLTLWLTEHIAESSKQKEVRQAMQLVTLELHDNLKTIQNYEYIYNNEAQMALRLRDQKFVTTNLSIDTILLYQQRLYGGLAKPYRFSTNALEMLKTSGLAAHITDKQLVTELLHCYNSIETFDSAMELYYNMRREVLTAYDNKNPTMPTQEADFGALFQQMTADTNIQSWLCALPRSFDFRFFEIYKTEIEETTAKLEEAYK